MYSTVLLGINCEMDNKKLLFATASASAMISKSASFIEQLLYTSEDNRGSSIPQKWLDLGVVLKHTAQRLAIVGQRVLPKLFIILFDKVMISKFGNYSLVSQRVNLKPFMSYIKIRFRNRWILQVLTELLKNLPLPRSRATSKRVILGILMHYLKGSNETGIGPRAASHLYGILVGTLRIYTRHSARSLRTVLYSD